MPAGTEVRALGDAAITGDADIPVFQLSKSATNQLRPARQGGTLRVTFDGSYNVSPRLSPDGRSMAFISRNGGRFQLAIMDLASKQVQILTDSHKDESPSFASNGRMILFATEMGGRGVLSAVSSDGRVKQRLSVSAGDVREPAWGPYLK